MIKKTACLLALLFLTEPSYAEESQADVYVKFVPVAFQEEEQAKMLKINLPYDKRIYLLAFDTFLANKNLLAAIAVAEKAVQANPNNLPWREKLVQVAIWSNKTTLAMQQLVYLLGAKKDKATLNQVVQLGNYTSHFDEVVSAGTAYLNKYPYDKSLILSLVYAYNGLGEPNQAIALLKRVLNYDPKKSYYTQLINIYTVLQDNAEIQQAGLRQKAIKGLTPALALTLAETYYSNNNIKHAEKILLEAVSKARVKDVDFWKTLAQNAWLLNDYPHAMLAYRMLSASKNLDISSTLQYIQILMINNPKTGIKQALDLSRQTGDNNGLIMAVNYLTSYYTLPLAVYLFSQLSPKAEKSLFNVLSYWVAKSTFLENFGEEDAAKGTILQGMQMHLGASDYQLIYLNFLINQVYFGMVPDALSLLPATLYQWQSKTSTYQDWLNAYANAYLVLNNYLMAYEIDTVQFEVQKTNLDYLNRFSSTASTFGYTKIARQIAEYGLSQIKKNELNNENVDIYHVFLTLAMPHLAINTYYQGLCWLAKQAGDTNKEALLDWALSNNQNQLALAKAIVNSYYGNRYPAWAQLKIAMQENDVQAIYRLLAQHASTLPKDDYVTAANQINDVSLAGLASVQTLRKTTAELDRNTPQMIQLETAAASSVNLTQEYDAYGVLEGNKTKVNAKINMGNNVVLEPYASAWFTKSSDPLQLINVPSVDDEAGIKYTKQTQDNWYRWNVGIRDDLATFATLSFEDRYNVTPDLRFDIELGYNQTATQTTNLWLTSVQDVANFALNYNFSSYDSIVASLNGSEFFSQEGTYVGNGLQMLLTANHKFWLAYPDYTIGWFGEVDKFGQNGSVTPFMTQVIPNGDEATLTSFIPEDYWQSGVNFNFGQNLLDTRTDRFRPYGNISLFYNSVSGKGNTIEAGLVGSILGCDQLDLYASQSKNSGGQAQKNQIVGIRYEYFYG